MPKGASLLDADVYIFLHYISICKSLLSSPRHKSNTTQGKNKTSPPQLPTNFKNYISEITFVPLRCKCQNNIIHVGSKLQMYTAYKPSVFLSRLDWDMNLMVLVLIKGPSNDTPLPERPASHWDALKQPYSLWAGCLIMPNLSSLDSRDKEWQNVILINN